MNKRITYGIAAALILAGLAGCGGQPSVNGKCTDKYIEYDGDVPEYTIVLTDSSGTNHHIVTEDDDFRSANCNKDTGAQYNAKSFDVPGIDD